MTIKKPCGQEEEYFAREEFERQRRMHDEEQRKLKAEERTRLRELHHMRCPMCGMQLVDVDYCRLQVTQCTECHGIWLSQEDLDTIRELEHPVMHKLLEVFKPLTSEDSSDISAMKRL